MAILVHRYDAPDRFVAGTVGSPGERTFFLQAREGNRITSVACEKQQVSVWPSTWTGCSTRCSGAAVRPLEVPPARDEAQRRRPAGRADHRGVPGRHHDDRLGSRASTGSSSSCSPTSMPRRGRGRPDDLDRPRPMTRHRPGGCRRGRGRRGVRGQDHRLVRPRVRGPRPGAGRRRAARRAPSACSRSSRPATSARGPTATGARCSEPLC